jgi:GNAT superfamily N-acetyltransferase
MRHWIDIVNESQTQYVVLGERHGNYQNFDFNGVDGFGTIRYDQGSVVIGYISVPEEQRGSGIGRAVIGELETLAKSLGISKIRGDALQGSEGFWESLGYKLSGPKTKRQKITKTLG